MNWMKEDDFGGWILFFKNRIMEILRGFCYYPWNYFFVSRMILSNPYISFNSSKKSFILKYIFINFYPHKFAKFDKFSIPDKTSS